MLIFYLKFDFPSKARVTVDLASKISLTKIIGPAVFLTQVTEVVENHVTPGTSSKYTATTISPIIAQ